MSYLQNVYSKTIAEEDSVDTCVQTIVLVALHFLKQSGADNPEVSNFSIRWISIIPDKTEVLLKQREVDLSW